MSLTATTTPKTEVKLQPSVRRRLLTELKTYAALKAQMDALKSAIDKRKGIIGGIREEAGVDSLSLEGFKITQVTGTTSKLNKQKLVELGCALAWIDEATEIRPKKSYEKISVPGEKEEGED